LNQAYGHKDVEAYINECVFLDGLWETERESFSVLSSDERAALVEFYVLDRFDVNDYPSTFSA
jgi:hypothetical protein